MPIERQTQPYEILIRLNAEGFVAAHVCDLERLVDTDTGDVLSEKATAARPVTKAEAGEYLGATNAKVIEQAQAMGIEKKALEDALAAMTAERDNLAARVADRELRLANILGQLKD